MRRVLVIDDSRLVRAQMQAALAPYGFEVEAAENGGVALQKLTTASWDLVFLDLNLPVMDGPTLLRIARAKGVTAPVVLVTSVSSAHVVSGLFRLGATHYILKPFTADQIRSTTAKILQLDPKLLDAPPPQILLQHIDPALPGELASLLPAHVLLDTSQGLAQSLDLVEEGSYSLVLLESEAPDEELVSIAGVLRRSLPAAGIFAVTSRGNADTIWSPDEGLDGKLSRPLTDALVNGFLYTNFVRPLIFVDAITARAAGFQGDEQYLPAYFVSITRTLLSRCQSSTMTDVMIDLSHLPPSTEQVAKVVRELATTLHNAGGAPTFRLAEPLRAALAGRADLEGILFV